MAFKVTAFVGILLPLAFCIQGAVSANSVSRDNPKMKVDSKVPLKAVGFDLREVQLLEGPFKHAQELDHQYLLSLNPDRLLHNFRVNAGLPSTARPLGGWEAPNCELRGHFVGHYLSACAHMFASTGDPKLKQNAAYVVAEFAKCQQKLGNGYLSAYPESFIDRVETGKPVWAPWYTLHKILAGLIDMYTLCDDRQALDVAEKMAAWAKSRMDRLSDAQMQAMLRNEQGGMNEALANLYAVTGKKEYLALAERFNHHAVLDPLAEGRDPLNGLHANTQIPKIIGAAREFELTGDTQMRAVADTFWNVVTKERSYVIGGNSDGEAFSPKEHLSHYLGPNTTETCNTYNMLKLTQHLFAWNPTAEYMDYYERALYNHILASQDPDTGMMCYYVPLRSGSHKNYNTPEDSFWCCTGTGVENHAHYGENIYAHDDGANLYLNLFIASQLTWNEKGIVLRQETRFPDEAETRLSFTCSKPTPFDLHIRHPYWANAGFQVLVNGKKETPGAPGSYTVVSRTWKSGDTVKISLPMQLHTEAFKDNPDRLAYLYGPIVLCAATDRRNDIPVIVTSHDRLTADVTAVPGKPLTFVGDPTVFRVAGKPEGAAVRLTPFYEMATNSYVVYWDLFSADQWQAKEDAVKAQQAQQKEFEARLVDSVHPGEEQNERDHKLTGDRTASGDFSDRKWRDAREGGWFSYQLRVLPDTPQELACTYWGSDGGGREFDILVDGTRLATQTLDNNAPEKFFTVTYPLSSDLLHGKAYLTVRFQAHPGRMAGGIFGCQVVKTQSPEKAQLSTVGTIRKIDPPEKGFFTKVLDYEGIPIKAPEVVDDKALFVARDRIAKELQNLPNVRYNLKMAGAELHIIGKDQGTSDLPEWRSQKGKPFDGNLTIDQRTRGMGGRLTSCGEENLLLLPTDRYRGRDICIHEFAHCIQGYGLSEDVRRKIRDQYHHSLEKGLWKGAYAATNEDEYFAELTMWYFGTHGDMGMTGVKPAFGPEGLKAYDPEAYALLDDLYSGRIPVARVQTVELTAYLPEREKDLRSGNETQSTRITFVNNSSKELKIYWLDSDGKRKQYGTVGAGERASQQTFASHVWLLADSDDKPVALFVAEAKPGLATIPDVSQPQPKSLR